MPKGFQLTKQGVTVDDHPPTAGSKTGSYGKMFDIEQDLHERSRAKRLAAPASAKLKKNGKGKMKSKTMLAKNKDS